MKKVNVATIESLKSLIQIIEKFLLHYGLEL